MALKPRGASAHYHSDDYDIAMREICRRADEPLQDDMRLFHPGEPIYEPPRRGSSMLRAFFVSVALTGCGWGLVKTHDVWRPWADGLVSLASAALERSGTQSADAHPGASAPLPPQVLPAAPLSTKDVAEAPGAAIGAPVADAGMDASARAAVSEGASAQSELDAASGADGAASGDGSAAAGQADAAPLPPPKADPGDPYQRRALAAGLHPELSRVLLTRMSDTDFRNARVAITKAIAEVGDQDTLVWPKKRVPKLALFKVHFVAGAPPDCRRYVVVVTKDGWSTTAQPMEQCGVKGPQHSAS